MLYVLLAVVAFVIVGNVARQRSARREELEDAAAGRARRARVRELRGIRDDDADVRDDDR